MICHPPPCDLWPRHWHPWRGHPTALPENTATVTKGLCLLLSNQNAGDHLAPHCRWTAAQWHAHYTPTPTQIHKHAYVECLVECWLQQQQQKEAKRETHSCAGFSSFLEGSSVTQDRRMPAWPVIHTESCENCLRNYYIVSHPFPFNGHWLVLWWCFYLYALVNIPKFSAKLLVITPTFLLHILIFRKVVFIILTTR